MNPDAEPQQNSNSQPEQAASPQPPVPPAQSTPTTAPVSPATPSLDQPKSNKTLISLIIAAVVLIIIAILVAGWFMWWSPAARAKSLSNDFMSAITSGDIDAAAKDSGADASYKTFLQNMAPKVKGSYKMIDSQYSDGKGYYLYSLSGAQRNYARTSVDKENGNLEIASFVADTQQLKLVPSKSSQSAEPRQQAANDEPAPAAAASKPAATAMACLTNDDYRWFEFDNSIPSVTFDTTFDPANFSNNATDDMFFKPNSAEESSFMSVYDTWANFAKHNSDKQWKFRLEGSTYGSDAGASAVADQLAQERADEVKTQLINRGVPSSRIIIDPPHSYSSEKQDDAMNEIYRRVQVVIDPTCTAATTTQPSSDSR